MQEFDEILKNDGLGVDEGCFAKVMQDSVWDAMTSDKIDQKRTDRFKKVLEIMKGDY